MNINTHCELQTFYVNSRQEEGEDESILSLGRFHGLSCTGYRPSRSFVGKVHFPKIKHLSLEWSGLWYNPFGGQEITIYIDFRYLNVLLILGSMTYSTPFIECK